MKCARHIKKLALVCATLLAQFGTARADITVFAAASLRGALDEIAALSDTPVTISYGGSGTIARQIAQGAPADVVILAHPRWMDWLESQNAILANSRVNIAHNSLVVIGPAGARAITDAREIQTRLEQGRLAIGQRDAVPAGIYTQEWLASIGQKSKTSASPLRLSPARKHHLAWFTVPTRRPNQRSTYFITSLQTHTKKSPIPPQRPPKTATFS
jgi:ABC-type molybdate transport system substrate-binding protein